LAHYQLGEVALRRGATDEAERRFERALNGFETYHAPSETMLANRALARLALDDGRLADADRRFLEAFRHAREERAERHLAAAAVGRARVAWLRGHARFAVGILDAARERPAVDRDTLDVVAATLREIEAAHGEGGLAALRHDARTIRIEDAEEAPTGIAGRFGRGGRGGRGARG
jgi:hypothetical protein